MNSPSVAKLRVLFVDDEGPIRDVMKLELPRMGHDATICEDGESALKALEKNTFDAAIIDLRMPGLSGWDVVDHIKQVSPETEIIISTGHGSMEAAIQALRKGAYDFIPKPCKLVTIANVLKRVGEKRAMVNKTIALENRLKAVEGNCRLVGDTAEMQQVKNMISKIAPTDSAVLILGETGTGKELVARRIHEESNRASMPFVAVNCGALPENLVESEFFGHRKGAFTGADTPRKGLFEVANGGTLFLDELGELDKNMQVKLLRFLESGEVRRVGENEAFHVDVRIVCATNRHLEDMVKEGHFREDLFFRVNTFEVVLPSLRERRDDIPLLARSLVKRFLKRSDIPDTMISPEALEAMKAHVWTGNVRELANAIEHSVILSGGNTILPEHLPTSVTNRVSVALPSQPIAQPAPVAVATPEPEEEEVKTLRQVEQEVILSALERNKGDKPQTARELGIALKTLYNKLNQYEAQGHSIAG
ncbi:sigma-54-dependent transcriptional regulator [Rubinisphaera brasiliensis]|uniref:Sigma54 specific transcriptional regulator, Fis family n=1 Tax=Rubinisphaera brasiliensis (strain ATCC 49424 / DSM 5305 / JCM 21570 / IAM 15109 / NBRC 103401 / IFAM 1448) TaxID=756272 RepID=F0SR00_RUBBR|nr:sigma-54 dependent transcriptional regulator [Rubinisphaera brasiliensis]ADY60221.1 sigma54 specific transcriptional regulator, Fis family [Rubinisphaera brasiliensis DSM 5305]